MTDSAIYPAPPADIHPDNIIGGVRQMRMEIMNTETRETWMGVEPATRDGFRALSPPPPFIKTGMASPSMDVAWFARSPGDPGNGPMRRLTIDGVDFLLVAKPGEIKPISDGLVEIEVVKHHTVGFGVGREVQILTTADGKQFVEVIDGIPGRALGSWPEGWSVRTVTLTRPWAVTLPCPAQTYFSMPSFRSFQGPLTDWPEREVQSGLT